MSCKIVLYLRKQKFLHCLAFIYVKPCPPLIFSVTRKRLSLRRIALCFSAYYTLAFNRFIYLPIIVKHGIKKISKTILVTQCRFRAHLESRSDCRKRVSKTCWAYAYTYITHTRLRMKIAYTKMVFRERWLMLRELEPPRYDPASWLRPVLFLHSTFWRSVTTALQLSELKTKS